MKHVVIAAHPKLTSFTMSVAKAYCEAVGESGDDVLLRDLYRMNFAPCLGANEIPGTTGFAAGPDVVSERQLLADVNVFAFVYPFWINSQPAMMKAISIGFSAWALPTDRGAAATNRFSRAAR